jgi:hypothetical protein
MDMFSSYQKRWWLSLGCDALSSSAQKKERAGFHYNTFPF